MTGYPAISDYAIIGDCRSAALISRTGSLDWLCWPRFDSPAIFAALLDRTRGGHWSITFHDLRASTRRYLPDTNVLETRFECASGVAVLTDLMPVASEQFKREHLFPDHEIVRQIVCESGEVEIEFEFCPRVDYGRDRPTLRPSGALGIRAEVCGGMLWLRSSVPLHSCGRGADALFKLHAGESAQFSLSYSEEAPAVLCPLGHSMRQAIERSMQWWRDWVSGSKYDGPARDAVMRSALTLKLMSYAPSGAIIAAPTTSLPERMGGDANWDYRYCWLRDAALTVRALLGLGFEAEVEAFMSWLLHATRLTQPQLEILYTIYGERAPRERTLDYLEGYAGSRPVRVGNEARIQLQLDVYGEVVDAVAQWALSQQRVALQVADAAKKREHDAKHPQGAALLQEGELRFDRTTQKVLVGFGRYVCEHWREPDEGIWEPRGPRQHHTHSRLLCWTALDRLVTLVEKGLLKDAPMQQFSQERAAIARQIHERAWNQQLGAYTATLNGEDMDASLLLMSWYGFEHADTPRMRSTYAQLRAQLGAGDLIRRNLADQGEGAFGICSFWEVEHLAVGGGSLEEATDLFERLLRYQNDLGLLAEEFTPKTGAALGNFPQAFTHVGLISAAIALQERAAGVQSVKQRSQGTGEKTAAMPSPQEHKEVA